MLLNHWNRIKSIKYNHTRVDICQEWSEYNQIHRHILPVFAIWLDGWKYKQVGFQLAWWKWSVNVFFNI